jgi:hypothetical protein
MTKLVFHFKNGTTQTVTTGSTYSMTADAVYEYLGEPKGKLVVPVSESKVLLVATGELTHVLVSEA